MYSHKCSYREISWREESLSESKPEKKITPPLLLAARETLISLIVLKYHKCTQWTDSSFKTSQVHTKDGVSQ